MSFGSTVDGGVGIPVVLPEHLNSLFSILRENSVQIHMYVYQSLQVRLLSNNCVGFLECSITSSSIHNAMPSPYDVLTGEKTLCNTTESFCCFMTNCCK